jgi:RNA polymerase sigma factor (sigma-70 family)
MPADDDLRRGPIPERAPAALQPAEVGRPTPFTTPVSRAMVRRRIHSITRDYNPVDDLEQETWIKWDAVQKSPWKSILYPKSYFLRIAGRIAIKWNRERKTEKDLLTRLAALELARMQSESLDIVEQSSLPQELEQVLKWILGKLPPRIGEAWTLRTIEGLSIAEVAARMSISEAAVKEYLAKAISRIMELLEQHEAELGEMTSIPLKRKGEATDDQR